MDDEQVPEGEVKKRVVNWVYSFYITTALLFLIAYIVAYKVGPVASSALDGAFGLLTVVVFTFLGVNTLDKSNILGKIGDGVKNSGTKIKVLTPEEMRRISGEPPATESGPITTNVTVNPPKVDVKSDG